tara:strand:+ start:642 stop:887 length:246 start_codon:yes stop_codon:yes gene_type:complete
MQQRHYISAKKPLLLGSIAVFNVWCPLGHTYNLLIVHARAAIELPKRVKIGNDASLPVAACKVDGSFLIACQKSFVTPYQY